MCIMVFNLSSVCHKDTVLNIWHIYIVFHVAVQASKKVPKAKTLDDAKQQCS